MKRVYAAALCGLLLAAAQAQGAAPALEAPTCGARIFVIMGVNRNYPDRENMRVPRGDFYIDGVRVTAVSKDPQIAEVDVPAGPVTLSWVPSSYDDDTRRQTKQNGLTLTLADTATAFVALDWFDDTPRSKTIGYRTEVVETRDTAFAGKRISFRRPLKTPCAGEMTAPAASSLIPSPAQIPATAPTPAPTPAPAMPVPMPRVQAPSAPAPAIQTPRVPDSLPALVPAPAPQPAIPPPPPPMPAPDVGPRPDLPDVSDSFMASLQMYYVVNARAGAPAFPLPTAEGPPLYTFPDGTELKVLAVSADKRWLTVQLAGNKTGYVSSAIVTSGVRAPK
jgi:hypothetical protein